MDFAGFPIASTSENLQRQIDTLNTEVKTIQTDLTTVENQVNTLSLEVSDLGVSGVFVAATPTTLTATVLTNITPSPIIGTLFIPSNRLHDGMAFRFRIFAHLTTPDVNNLRLYWSATVPDPVNDPCTPPGFFGVPVFSVATPQTYEFVVIVRSVSSAHAFGTLQTFTSPPFLAFEDGDINPLDDGLSFSLWGSFQNAGATLQIRAMTFERIANF